jgi:3D (Asp-Asp-Asp) domain-containing protein
MKKNIIKIVSIIILVIIAVIAILTRKTTKVESPEVETTTKVTTTVAETTITTTTTPVTTTTITELVTTLEETTITETEAITEKLIQETVYIEPKVAVPATQIEVTVPVLPGTDAPAITQEIINPPANNTVDYNNMTSLGSLKITGYVATGNKTASGVYPYVGGCAMSRSHGIPFGSTVYVEGLGYYTVNDTGCAYGVVDIFCSTVQECYNLTGNYNVYLVN